MADVRTLPTAVTDPVNWHRDDRRPTDRPAPIRTPLLPGSVTTRASSRPLP